MNDVLIIGGGVIGLSIAYELAGSGVHVQLIDRGDLGQEASWAGAGILPPVNRATTVHPYDQLRALSFCLHAEWASRLRDETGIDTGYRRCGALYLARTIGEAAALRGLYLTLREEQVAIERVAPADVALLEPALAPAVEARRFQAAYDTPEECQLRNRHHLRALIVACRQLGVDLVPHVAAEDFVLDGERLEGVRTSAGVLRAERYCLASGAWTEALLRRLGVPNGILPIRGQMLLYRCAQQPFTRILNEGNRYLVAREDGYVLAGSTEEEVGFDKRTTPAGLADLRSFAEALVPALAEAKLEKSWAGLRPATFDGLPYLGQIPALSNAFVAAGHFRSGLYLSGGTAVLMSQLMRGEEPDIDLEPFRVGRG
jgi:glycine oxidase